MKLFTKSHDGGKDSGVTGYFLIEWKNVFSIVLLNFKNKYRENYHSHAFNAYTWWLKGIAYEYIYGKEGFKTWNPSIFPKYTSKEHIHKICVEKNVWAISFRGPWNKRWQEVNSKGEVITLTHGRKII